MFIVRQRHHRPDLTFCIHQNWEKKKWKKSAFLLLNNSAGLFTVRKKCNVRVDNEILQNIVSIHPFSYTTGSQGQQ